MNLTQIGTLLIGLGFVIYLIITQIKVYKLYKRYRSFFIRMKDLNEEDQSIIRRIFWNRIIAFLITVLLLVIMMVNG